jgi:hypothetical protein
MTYTITKEEEIKGVVILEIIKNKNLQSAFLYGSPVDIWPNRVYVKLKLFKQLVA